MKVGKCWECEVMKVEIHHHHPVPRSRGGKKTIPLCLGCHAKAHHRKKSMASSKLTKEGLARAKGRGVKLGGPNIAEARKIAVKVVKQRADEFAAKVAPYIQPLRDRGLSLEAIADRLNEMKLETRRGRKWYAMTVSRCVNRVVGENN